MRVYGALMWSLGKVFHTPEVARVYIGSFWEEPLKYEINQRLFYNEENDLIQDLQNLTKSSVLRKVNDLIKRYYCIVYLEHSIFLWKVLLLQQWLMISLNSSTYVQYFFLYFFQNSNVKSPCPYCRFFTS